MVRAGEMARALFQRTRVQFPALHGGSQSSATLVPGDLIPFPGALVAKQAHSAAIRAGRTPIDIQ